MYGRSNESCGEELRPLLLDEDAGRGWVSDCFGFESSAPLVFGLSLVIQDLEDRASGSFRPDLVFFGGWSASAGAVDAVDRASADCADVLEAFLGLELSSTAATAGHAITPRGNDICGQPKANMLDEVFEVRISWVARQKGRTHARSAVQRVRAEAEG